MRKFKKVPSNITASANIAFTCPKCHNRTLYCVDEDIKRPVDVGWHYMFVCDECAYECMSEPQYDNSIKFVSPSIEASVDVSDYEPLGFISDGGRYYRKYRKIENGRGKWAAQEYDMLKSMYVGDPFEISYEQALGYEGINNAGKLGRELGRLLLPKRGVNSSTSGKDYINYMTRVIRVKAPFFYDWFSSLEDDEIDLFRKLGWAKEGSGEGYVEIPVGTELKYVGNKSSWMMYQVLGTPYIVDFNDLDGLFGADFDECFEVIDKPVMSSTWMGKYWNAEGKMKKVYFESEGDFDYVERLFEDIIPEPFTKSRLLGRGPSGAAVEKDGFTRIDASSKIGASYNHLEWVRKEYGIVPSDDEADWMGMDEWSRLRGIPFGEDLTDRDWEATRNTYFYEVGGERAVKEYGAPEYGYLYDIKSSRKIKDATYKTDRRLAPTSVRYRGYLISLDRGGDGYNIYDKNRELEDAGYASIDKAKKAVDEIIENEGSVYASRRSFKAHPKYAKGKIQSSEDIQEDDEDSEYDLDTEDQEYDSAETAINAKYGKLPAAFKLATIPNGALVLDYGGGKPEAEEIAQNYLDQFDATEALYDPYNQTRQHNREVVKQCRQNGGADICILSNVLNVIKEKSARMTALKNIQKLMKSSGVIYITVYEGDGSEEEGATRQGYQLRRKTERYLDEIQQVFPDATRKGKLIIAHPSGSAVTSSVKARTFKKRPKISKVESAYRSRTSGRKPKYWDTMFRVKVIDAYKDGELTLDNIREWETEYNGGRWAPNLGTREILQYYINNQDSIESAEDCTPRNRYSDVVFYDLFTTYKDDDGWADEDHLDQFDTYEEALAAAKEAADGGPCHIYETGPEGTHVVWSTEPDEEVAELWPGYEDTLYLVEGATVEAGRLVDTPKEVIDQLINILADYGFILDTRFKENPGRTWMGNVHLQVINDGVEAEDDNVRPYIPHEMIDRIHELSDSTNCPITWSFGVDRNGNPTGGLDISKQYVEDVSPVNGSQDIGLRSAVYDFLDEISGYADYNQKIEDVSEEFGISPDEAEGLVCDWIHNYNAEWSDTADQEDIEGSQEINLPAYAVEYVSGYAGNGVNRVETKYFRNENEQKEFAKELKDKGAYGVRTYKLDNFYHTVESARKLNMSTLESNVYNRAVQMMKMFGFPDDEIDDYLVVEVEPAEEGWIKVEVRAELTYESMDEMAEALNQVVKKYDKNAYFDHVTYGIIEAYIEDKRFNINATEDLIQCAGGLTSDEISAEVPSPYDKYFKIEPFDDGSFQVGEKIRGYDCHFLAALMPTEEYEDVLEFYPILTDDPDYPVCELVGGRLYPVGIKDIEKALSVSDTITGADYGGVFDIDPEQFFTREELDEFGNHVVAQFNEGVRELGSPYYVGDFYLEDIYMDTPSLLHLEASDGDTSYSADVVIDMRRIRRPLDIYKYTIEAVIQMEDEYRCYHNIDIDASETIECDASSELEPDGLFHWDPAELKELHDDIQNAVAGALKQNMSLRYIADNVDIDVDTTDGNAVVCSIMYKGLSQEDMWDAVDAANEVIQRKDNTAFFGPNLDGQSFVAYIFPPYDKNLEISRVESSSGVNGTKYELIEYIPDSGENGMSGDEFSVLDSGFFSSLEEAEDNWSDMLQDENVYIKYEKSYEDLEPIDSARYDVPEPSLDPPEYDDPLEESYKSIILIDLDDVVIVGDDSLDFEEELPEVLLSPEGKSDWYISDTDNEAEFKGADNVVLDDSNGIAEKILDLIIDRVPTEDGRYRVKGTVKLVYDVSSTGYPSSDEPDDYSVDNADSEVEFNWNESEFKDGKVTKIDK